MEPDILCPLPSPSGQHWTVQHAGRRVYPGTVLEAHHGGVWRRARLAGVMFGTGPECMYIRARLDNGEEIQGDAVWQYLWRRIEE